MTKRKSKTTKKRTTTKKRSSSKAKQPTTSVFHLLALSLVLSLAWALANPNSAYPILLASIFGLSLSVHVFQSGADVWDNYVKKYKKKKGASELFFAPNKTVYYLQMYLIFPAMGVFCFLGIILSAKVILGM